MGWVTKVLRPKTNLEIQVGFCSGPLLLLVSIKTKLIFKNTGKGKIIKKQTNKNVCDDRESLFSKSQLGSKSEYLLNLSKRLPCNKANPDF